MEHRHMTRIRTMRFAPARNRRLEVMLGTACLILAIACLLLAGVIVFGARSLVLRTPGASSAANASAPVSTASDSQIRDTIMQEFHDASCCESLREGRIGVSVNHGQVMLTGDVASLGDRNAALFLARVVNGVSQVQDNLVVRSEAAGQTAHTTAQPVQESQAASKLHKSNARVHPTPARALTQDEREAQTWVDLGNKELNADENPNYDSAIRYFKLALAVEPHNAEARKGLERAQKAKKAEDSILKPQL